MNQQTDKPLSIEERVQRVAREILEEYDQIVRFVSNQRDRSVESDLRHNGKSLELVIEKSLRRHFGDLDAAPAESQRDIQELRLAGAASDHIWAMVDGYEPHCIGLRMDSGDSGVVYMTPEQAHDVIDNLNSILWQLLEIPHASEQSTRGFSNVSINGEKVAGAQGSEPTEEQKRACPACSSIIPEEGHAKDCPDPAGEFSPSRTPERRSGPGERRVKDLGCICARGDGRLGTNCQPQDKLSRRTGPPDRRRKPSQDSAIGDETSQRPTERHGESDLASDSHALRGSAARPGKKEGGSSCQSQTGTANTATVTAANAGGSSPRESALAGTSVTSAAPRCPECLSDSRQHGNLRECTNAWHSYAAGPAPQVTAPEPKVTAEKHGPVDLTELEREAFKFMLMFFHPEARETKQGRRRIRKAAHHAAAFASSLLAERNRTIAELRAKSEHYRVEAINQGCKREQAEHGLAHEIRERRTKRELTATAERLRGLLREANSLLAKVSGLPHSKDFDALKGLRQRIQKELEGRP